MLSPPRPLALVKPALAALATLFVLTKLSHDISLTSRWGIDREAKLARNQAMDRDTAVASKARLRSQLTNAIHPATDAVFDSEATRLDSLHGLAKKIPFVRKTTIGSGHELTKEIPLARGAANVPGSDAVFLHTDQMVINISLAMPAPVTMDQADPHLIQYIRAHFLHPPSNLPLNLEDRKNDPTFPSQGQSEIIREIVGNKRDGFFIECGALDGETRSNSLDFEKLGWSGLLVEGDPKNFELVLKKNRKAWTANVCLSRKPHPEIVLFEQKFNVGKISSLEPSAGYDRKGHVEVQCVPVYSLMAALNVTTVDYFSLDVEGAELEVLQTIPWEKVFIKTLSVEFIHGALGKDGLQLYMEERGYWLYGEISGSPLANDLIFVHNNFKQPQDFIRL